MAKQIIERPMPEQCTMATYEAIADNDLVQYKDYTISDYPSDGANATQMAYALTCKRLFPEGTIIMFSGETDDTYTKGHCYQIKTVDENKTWVDITPKSESTIPLLVGTQEKPINLATDLEVGGWYMLTGRIHTTDGNSMSTRNNRMLAYRTTQYRVSILKCLGWSAAMTSDDYIDTVYTIDANSGDVQSPIRVSTVRFFNGQITDGSPIDFYAPTDSGTSGQILQSNGSNNAPTWIDMPKGQIQTLVYDNTTLADHIADILSHVNAENGGTLLSIGFKTGTASVLANGTKNTVASDGTNTVSTVSAAVLKPSTFYSFRAADINKTDDITSLTLNGPNGLDGCSSTNIDINYDASTVPTPTMLCQASGCSTNLVDGNIETTIFKGVNLLNIPLEHLVIDYYTV